MNEVANKPEYLARLQDAIQHTHRCGAVFVETVAVDEVFQGKTVWKGEVEVFLVTHPRANHVTPGAITMTRASGLLPFWKSPR